MRENGALMRYCRPGVLLAALALATGGADSATASPARPPLASKSVTLTGTRIVSVTGSRAGLIPTGSAPGTYPVTETDRGLMRRTIVYGAPSTAPAFGIQPRTETVVSVVATGRGGPTLLRFVDTTIGIDRNARRDHAVSHTRTVTTAYGDGVAAREHVVEIARAASGVIVASVDVTRTTHDDGSFDEIGSLGSGETHATRVRADFGATAHDRTRGLRPRDVTVAASRGTDASRALAVKISRRTYAVPRWFASAGAPTTVGHAVTPNARLDAACGYAPHAVAPLEVRDERIQIDPTGTTTGVVHAAFYDTPLTPLCRIDLTLTTYVDVTNGRTTAARSDRTVVSAARRRGRSVRYSGPTGTR